MGGNVMNSKTAKMLRKIARNEKTEPKTVKRTYMKLNHHDKRLFKLTGVTRILDDGSTR